MIMRPRLLPILVIIHSLCLCLVAEGASPYCPKKCGDIPILFPFGVGPKCSHNASFEVTCLPKNSHHPKPYLSSVGGLEIVEISVEYFKRVTVMHAVSPLNCSPEEKTLTPLGKSLVGTPFSVDRFTTTYLAVVGCKTEVWLVDPHTNSSYIACKPLCGFSKLGCYGTNCCSISIKDSGPVQELILNYKAHVQSTEEEGICGIAFLVDYEWLSSNYKYYTSFWNHSNPLNTSLKYVPMQLSWDFNDTTTRNHHGVKCRDHMDTYSATLDDNYTEINRSECYCQAGFEGNPYDVGGCDDINECSNTTLNNCTTGTTCVNTPGSFTCITYDHNKIKAVIAGISSGAGALLMLVGAWISSKVIKKRIKASRKKKFFKNNGGLLLQQQLSSGDGATERVKLFTSKELVLATDGYNDNRILGRGGQGTVYKGMLPDGRIVAVKKSKKMGAADIEAFINEVVILSQINHRNVVKLLGCCLETEVPLLVYEFSPNGTLFEHIHDQNDECFPLSWKMRVRIATEAAGALSYLHSAASVPIYHRDIKSSNILLDDKYRAKVSDFGTSRSVSIDQTHLTTKVIGTFGYVDPEYFQSSQFTEKSDVYSFGVVMVELLTGEKAVSKDRDETGRSLVAHFLQSMEENNLFDIVDSKILKEGRVEEIVAVAKLARRCLNLTGKRRPTMKAVAAELTGIQMMEDGSTSTYNPEDVEFDSDEINEDNEFSSTSNNTNMNVSTAELTKSPLLFGN